MDRVSPKARSSSHREDLGMRNVFPQMGGLIGLQQGIRGGRGGRGVRQQTGFLVNQSEQGKGNDAANSIPVANPVVLEKKTWASVVATNQRSAVKQRYFPPASNTDIVVDLPPRENIEKWKACLIISVATIPQFMRQSLNDNTTADKSDYLCTNIQGGSQTVLHVESLGHALHGFIGITWPCPFCNSYFLGL
ncbi:hypothetical protein TEA_002875 [Camellia sinensis var. sinensis]|uniref:Uncharacterized protein n=1 Tax=Camellia sinensis var. sinensis TaxID=542762 RepID=A0A4S4CXR8_CAMSN|nr:hypothetical protein TEA_002875 [Camellia sinensis var. sinensis]